MSEWIHLSHGAHVFKNSEYFTEDEWNTTDWSQAFANDASYLQGNAKGGIPKLVNSNGIFICVVIPNII